MPRYKPREAAARCRRIADALRDEVTEEAAKIGDDARAIAVALSSGPYDYGQLAYLDHPYATRHGIPQLPAQIINAQTGTFRESWYVWGPVFRAGSVVVKLINSDPTSGYLKYGTERMFARPIDDAIRQRLGKNITRRYQFAIRRALKTR